MKKKGLCINDTQDRNKGRRTLRRSGRPRLTGKKTLPPWQNGDWRRKRSSEI